MGDFTVFVEKGFLDYQNLINESKFDRISIFRIYTI